MNKKLHFSSDETLWETPIQLFDYINNKYGPLMLDVCALAHNSKCDAYIHPEENGLKQDWLKPGRYDYRCFLNPPYSKPEQPCKPKCTKKKCLPPTKKYPARRGHCIDYYIPGQVDWVKKAVEESKKGCKVVCLLPARTDTTNIFHKYIYDKKTGLYRPGVNVEFIEGRVSFLLRGKKLDPAPFPSMIVVFDLGGINV